MRARVSATAVLAALALLAPASTSLTPSPEPAPQPRAEAATFLGPAEPVMRPTLRRSPAATAHEASAHEASAALGLRATHEAHTGEYAAPASAGVWKTRWRRTAAPSIGPVTAPLTAPTTTPASASTPTTAAPTSASYGFLARGADRSAARWDACAPVRWKFNPANAPAGGLEVVRSAFDELAASSGLRFEYAGTTTTPVSFEYLQAQSYQTPGPVVVGWTPRGHSIFASHPAAVVGFARVRYVQARDVNGSESFRIFAGVIALDSADTAPLTGSSSWRTFALHEIGHLAGLGHPSDSSQIMHSVIPARTSLNAGDRAGLAYVGTQTSCMSKAY